MIKDYKQLVEDILEEYKDELTKEACDDCEDCNSTVMCLGHSILSLLQGDTMTTLEIHRKDEK